MRIILSLFLLLLSVTAAHATLPTGLTESLRAVDGVVIKANNGEWLIDLGTLNGVREGDLVAVLAAGEEVKHPVTGASLGQIDKVKTFLRVTRIKPDFSWARQLDQAAAIRPTDPVRRLAEAPAIFIDKRGDSRPFFTELQQGLPHLAWRPWGETSLGGPGLIFTLDRQTLTLGDEKGVVLESWAVAPPPAPVPQAPAVTTALAAPTVAPTMSRSKAEVSKAMQLVGPKLNGKMVGVTVADFDGDGRMEIAAAVQNRVEIGRYNGKEWTPVTGFDLPELAKALTIDSADLDKNGRAELLVTAARGDRLTSQIWAHGDKGFQPLATEIPWFFRVMELTGEGRVALAQELKVVDRPEYVGRPFRLLWNSGKLQAGAPVENFGADILHGCQSFVVQGTPLWAILTDSDRLAAYDADGKKLWQGDDRFGGGESFIERKARRSRDENQRVFIRSRIGTDGDLVIVPQNQGVRSFKNLRMAEKSRLVALTWTEFGLEEVWSSPLRDGYLADFVAADFDGDGTREYLLAGTYGSEEMLDEPLSALFLFKVPK